jgi:hypothetical protein
MQLTHAKIASKNWAIRWHLHQGDQIRRIFTYLGNRISLSVFLITEIG